MNADFEQGIREYIHSSTRQTEEVGSYILDSGGKRLRPLLVFMIGEAIGLPPHKILPLAYTVELLHTASLLHDDVVDGTETRRSKPTANKIYGDKPALLVGDYLFGSALEVTCHLGDLRVATQMIATIKKMSEGELKELEHSHHFHADLEVYLDIIYLKTATLFEFCLKAPGLQAGLSPAELEALTAFGRDMGLAFQIVDDIINLSPLSGDDKDAFNDIAEGKSTLPLIYLFRQQPELLHSLPPLDPEERQARIISRLETGVLQQSRETARTYCTQAVSSLAQTRFLSEDLAGIPKRIMSQLEDRF